MKKQKTGSDDLLARGVGKFVDPEGIFQKKLAENPKSVVIKFGVDPTRPDIHLGHAVVLRKLRKFQDLGCKIIFLIGDFTSQIGDPTGKSKVRPVIDQGEIERNMQTYLDQVGKILKTDPDVFSWIRNSDWYLSISDLFVEKPVVYTDNEKNTSVTFPPNSFFAKAAVYDATRMQKTHAGKRVIHDVTVRNLLGVLRHVTHSALIDRDMFQERIGKGEELYMHEMLYPVLQGIDSSILAQIYGSCDAEVGGTDQTFNMLMGRTVMKAFEQAPQAVIAFEILEGLDGKEKMSKSLDNYIAITDSPQDMYGKVMSIPDSSIAHYFELCTYTPMADVEKLKTQLKKGKNPKDIKARLAKEIVEIYHGQDAALSAETKFQEMFSQKKIPDDAQVIEAAENEKLADVLVKSNLVSSNSEYKRLVNSGAIEHLESGEKIAVFDAVAKEGNYRIGKKKFVRIAIK